MEWNRKRVLKERGVVGSHTSEEWGNLKKYYNLKCAECGYSESKLKIERKGTSFNKLTKDHIIPISKGGTDYWQVPQNSDTLSTGLNIKNVNV